MDTFLYWDMTYKEILAHVNGYQAREKSKLMNQASLIHNLGYLMAYGFHSPKQYPKLSEAFPGLFDEAIQEQKKEKLPEQWEVNKARMQAITDLYNPMFIAKQERGEIDGNIR